MKAVVFFVFVLVCLPFWSQQTLVLPGFKNGSWSILDTNGRILKSTAYSYIHFFDESNTATFIQKGKYGIIDEKGEELVPAIYISIERVTKGLYAGRCEMGWELFTVLPCVQKVLTGLDTVPLLLNANYFQIEKDSIPFLYFLPNQTVIRSIQNDRVISSDSEMLVLKQDSTGVLCFDKMGKQLGGSNWKVLSSFQPLALQDSSGQIRLYDQFGEWNVPFNVRVFKKGSLGYCIGDGAQSYLVDCSSRAILFQGNFSSISEYDNSYWYVEGNAGVNLINKTTKQALFPTNASSFYLHEKGYTVFFTNETSSLFDKNGRQLLPGRYDHFWLIRDLAQVHILDKTGLVSLKTQKNILPIIYNSISLDGLRVKATTDEVISYLELSPKHQVINRMDAVNNVVIHAYTIGNNREYFKYDERLLALGWYIDSTWSVKNNQMTYLWGLKNTNDSTLLTPRSMNLHYMEGPFSLVTHYSNKVKSSRKSYMLYDVWNWKTGKRVISNLTYIDHTGFRNNTFTKITGENFCGILTDSGTVQKMTFLSDAALAPLRYCVDGEIKPNKTICDTSFVLPTISYNAESCSFFTDYMGRYQQTYVASHGKWNFLSETGEPMFAQSFQFANDFVGQLAIVKQNNKWGVTTKDSLIIPSKFAKIERIIQQKDSFFLCQLPGKSSIFRSDFQPIEGLTSVRQLSSHFFIAIQNNQQVLYDPTGKVLGEDIGSIRLLDANHVIAKKKKYFTVLDVNGEAVFSGNQPIEHLIFERYGLIQKSSTKYVLSDGDQLLLDSVSFSFIGASSSKMVILKDNYELYSSDLKVLKRSKNKLYPGEHCYAEQKENEIKVVWDDRKVLKLKNVKWLGFYNDLPMVEWDKQLLLFASNGDTLLNIPKVQSFTVIQNGWLAVEDQLGHIHFFNGEKKVITPLEVKRYQYLGEECFSFPIAKGKEILWNAQTNATREVSQAIGKFGSGICPVKLNGLDTYLDTELEMVVDEKFLTASTFSNETAIVRDGRGVTLMDRSFMPMSFPSFKNISYLGAGFYQASAQPEYVLYRSDGTIVIENPVQHIHFIGTNLIQTIHRGTISYFRKDGTVLF